MDFVVQWLAYLLAFLAGSLVAWAATLVLVKPAGAEEAPAGQPGAAGAGAR